MDYDDLLDELESIIDRPGIYADWKTDARNIIEKLREYFTEQKDIAADLKWRD